MPKSSELPPAPDVTAGYVWNRYVVEPGVEAGLDLGGSFLAQMAVQKTVEATGLLGDVTPTTLKDILPIGETANSTALQSILLAAGAYVSEFVTDAFIEAKRKVGLEPDNYLLRKLWQLSIRLQGPSFVWAGVKSGAAFVEHPERFNGQGSIGVYVTLVSGGMGMLDNLIPRSEKGEAKDLIVPALILAGGLTGYFLTPNEMKPAVAGGVVATLANFSENAAEVLHLAVERRGRRVR